MSETKPSDEAEDTAPAKRDEEVSSEALARQNPEYERPGVLAMARILGAFVIVGLFAVGGLFGLKFLDRADAPAATRNISAKLELAAGEVELVRATRDGEGEGEAERVLSGTPLPAGAVVRTAPGARALIRLSDGSRVFMRDHSALTLGGEGEGGVELKAGEIWLETPPLGDEAEPLTHRIAAVELTLAEGGASLGLGDDGAVTVYVSDGSASVSTKAGREQVEAGEQAQVSGEGKPKVEPVAYWDDWTGGMAQARAGGRIGGGSGALYAVDRSAPPGTPALPLQISSQTVDVAIQDGMAETRVDQRFFNGSDRDVEGWYWFTVPEGAMLVGFELETDGELIEGEIVERKQAAATYESAIVSNDNPALLEWIDERTVRAKIYPVPSLGERRVVVRYQQLLSESDGKLRYSYPLAAPGEREAPTLEEFTLAVELRGDLAQRYTISTLDEATVSNQNRLISMRRSGYTPRADFELELTRKAGEGEHDEGGEGEAKLAPLRLSEFEVDPEQARYVMLRWLPNIEFEKLEAPRADVVVVVDTSAFGDDAEHQSRVAVAEALLRSLAEDDHFAVVAADLDAEVLYPAKGLEAANTEAVDAALERLTAYRPGGATDLGAIFERALERVHGTEQPAIVYVGDGLATSGERGADALTERLRRALSGSRARLFTVGVGPTVDERLLERLARVGGGESLRVESPDQAVAQALELSGAIKTPTLTELRVDLGAGLDDRFDNATGKLARGQELVILARTHSDLPESVQVSYRLGGVDHEPASVPIVRSEGALDRVVPKLWADARIERLLGDGRGPQAVRGKVLALGLEYGLMTPFTSFLALDSEYAYARKGIERRQRPWDVELLGAALPSAWEIREDPPAYADEPSASELLLGALSAPMGCSAKSADEAAPARQLSEEDDAKVSGRYASPEPESEPATATAERSKGDARGPMGGEKLEAEEGRMGAAEQAADFEAPLEEELAAAPPAPPSRDGAGGGSGSNYGSGGDSFAGKGRASGKRSAKKKRARPKPSSKSKAPTDDPSFVDDLAAAENSGVLGALDQADKNLDGLIAHEDDEISEATIALGGQGQQAAKDRASRRRNHRPRVRSTVARDQELPCSDASARPLSQRKILWEQRLAEARDMTGRLTAYEGAAASCELKNWRHQRVFLQLLQATAATEAEVELLIAHFWEDPEAKTFIVRALQRRLVDHALIDALERALYGDSLDWRAVDLAAHEATSGEEALEIVQTALARYPDASPEELLPLTLVHMDLLHELGRSEEAITVGRRLRERGLMTPALAQHLGEILVATGATEEAKRVFSEIVEYDPGSEHTRRLLGDIFLRHGWYQGAYRQYSDLVELSDAPADRIRLARAAAGAGRVDEGLRRLRKVATGEGRPGADDPRRWARLHAAVLLAGLQAEGEVPEAALTREFKRLQLFDAPTTWTFLVWRDLEHRLTLGAAPLDPEASKAEREAAEATAMLVRGSQSAGDTGLWAVQRGDLDGLEVRHQGEVPAREVAYERVIVTWDGATFRVARQPGVIAAKQAFAEPEAPAEDDGGGEGDDEPEANDEPE